MTQIKDRKFIHETIVFGNDTEYLRCEFYGCTIIKGAGKSSCVDCVLTECTLEGFSRGDFQERKIQ